MRSGFSLLELVIALFMAALISLSLFQLLTTTRKSVKRITNVIEVDLPFIAFYNQLEKDVLGMFTPRSSLQAFVAKSKQAEEKSQKKEEKSKKKEEKKPKVRKGVPHVFSIEAKGGGTEASFFLSFITTGALTVLDKDGSVVPTSSLKRVAYILMPDPQRPGLMHLMYRFTVKDLSLDTIKKDGFTPSYEILSGIKHLEAELTLYEYVESKEGDEDGKKGKKSEEGTRPTVTVLKEWNEEEIWQKYKSLIPAYLKLRGTIADLTGVEYPFEFLFKVMAYTPYTPKKPKEKKEPDLFKKLEDIAGKIFGDKKKKHG